MTTPFRLIRPFGAPPVDVDRERVILRLEDVPGLVAASLNDQEIARPHERTPTIEQELPPPLPSRNVLVLEVDPLRLPASPMTTSGWGQISLVIVSSEEDPKA